LPREKSDNVSCRLHLLRQPWGLGQGVERAAILLGYVVAVSVECERKGPSAARRVADPDEFLDAYAGAAERLRSPICIRVGVLWREPAAGAIQTGQFLEAAGIDWAATGALSASVLAPMQTEAAPLEIYVAGKTWSDVRRAALAAGLQEMDGGGLVLRPFPTPAGANVTETITDGLRSVRWPRVYADLRISGVRGEDVAEHLREEMTTP
jgi:hypothetical protein